MKIALAQIDCAPGELKENTKKIVDRIVVAASQGCELILLPELSDTGYGEKFVRKAATPWEEEGSFYQVLTTAAKENSISVLCGLSEKKETEIYNSLVAISSKGELLSNYHKQKLFTPAGEHLYTKAGNAVDCVELGGNLFGLSICYDLRFPEITLEQVSKGATVLVNVAAWPSVRIDHWRSLLRARAIESQAFVLAVNRVGSDGGITFGGKSLVCEPDGTLGVIADETNEELLVFNLEFDKVAKFRKAIPSVSSRCK